VFDFGPVPENPTVPTGRYLVAGFVSARPDGATAIALVPDRWIAQPPGYVMVGLTALVDPPVRTLRGEIELEGCSVVDLARVQ
jgi:hypothetical protein